MDWLQILVLALVQGITEFLPISSSAHLILVPYFFDWPDQGLGFDLAVHLGTLVAVVGYYWRDILAMAVAWLRSFVTRRLDSNSRMAWGLILATLPAIGFGLLLGSEGETLLRVPWIIATTSIVFGLLLGWADWRGRTTGKEEDLGFKQYLILGFLQAVALIPGSSRSGMTIMGGRGLGLGRAAAARVSFFMAIPVTLAAIVYEAVHLVETPVQDAWGGMAIAAVLACVSAVITIHLFLRMLQSMGMMPFVIYRVLLGILLFALFGFSA